ncbi:MAG: transglutaminase family protein [Candidatus Hodarchaeota archaeon]
MEWRKPRLKLNRKSIVLNFYIPTSKREELINKMREMGWKPVKLSEKVELNNNYPKKHVFTDKKAKFECINFAPAPNRIVRLGNVNKLRFYHLKGFGIDFEDNHQLMICYNPSISSPKSAPFCVDHLEWGTRPTYRIIERIRVGVFTRDKNPQIFLKTILFTNRFQRFQILKRKPEKIYQVKNGFFGKEKLIDGPKRGYRIIERIFEVSPVGYSAQPPPWGKVKDIDRKITQRGKLSQKYWEVSHPKIKNIADSIDSSDDIYKLSWVIANIVQNHITYREHLTRRLGALGTLQKKYGDCDEFTDLFITLCRAIGLPARRIVGLFIKPDLSVENHAWAEMYSPVLKEWIPVDVALGYFGFIGVQHLSRKIEETYSSVPDYSLTVKSRQHYQGEIEQEGIWCPEIKSVSNGVRG